MHIPEEIDRFISKLIPTYFRNMNARVVYHYTSTSAAINIIEKCVLYISSVQNMNDPFEIQYSLNLLKDIVSIARISAASEIEKEIRNFLQSDFVDNVESYISRMFLFSSIKISDNKLFNCAILSSFNIFSV